VLWEPHGAKRRVEAGEYAYSLFAPRCAVRCEPRQGGSDVMQHSSDGGFGEAIQQEQESEETYFEMVSQLSFVWQGDVCA